MGWFSAYALVVGGFTAGVQIVRGVVRGAGKLIEGEPRAALAEVAGGVLAPLASAVLQVCRLGEDVCRAAGALTGAEEEPEPAALAGGGSPVAALRSDCARCG